MDFQEKFKFPFEPNEVDYDLWRLFSDTHRLISHASSKHLRAYGLTHEMAALLSSIYLLGDQTMPIDLARVLRRTPQTITGILKRMEEKGLVQKVRDPNKLNTFRISLTAKGLDVYKKASLAKAYSNMFRKLTPENRKIFVDCLHVIKAEAQKYQ